MQSAGQLWNVSPGSHIPLPHLGPPLPQSVGHDCGVSPGSHIALPHLGPPPPQSIEHDCGVSPGSHIELPHMGALPQSFGHEVCVSPGSHLKLPQLPVHRSVLGTHFPLPHVDCQHKSPLVQVVASGKLTWEHPVFGSQLSVVHGLPSSQSGALDWQLPYALHISPWVQALPSSQNVPASRNAWLHLSEVHASLVHGLPSLHWVTSLQGGHTSWPEVHVVSLHESFDVHGLPSSHIMPFAEL